MPLQVVLKIITAGDGGVGKTTLLHRYVGGVFLESTQMTLGVEFLVKELEIQHHVNGENQAAVLQLWDFGGQAQFRHLLGKYAIGAKGAVLMFDLTRLITLDKIDQWVQICRKYDKNLPIIFLGSKSDLDEDIRIEDGLAEEIREKYGLLKYLKVSSKTGENVNRAFELLVQEILERKGYL